MQLATLALMCAASGAEAKALDAALPQTFTRAGGLLDKDALRQESKDPHRVHAAQMGTIEALHARSMALGTRADASSSPEGPTIQVKLGEPLCIKKCKGNTEAGSHDTDCANKCPEDDCTEDQRWCEDLSKEGGECTDQNEKCPEIFHSVAPTVHLEAVKSKCHCAGTNSDQESYSYQYDCDQKKKCPATCAQDERWCKDLSKEGGECTLTSVDCPKILHSPTIYQEAPKRNCQCAGEDIKGRTYSYDYECGNNEKCPADCENTEEKFCPKENKCLPNDKFEEECPI